ncbi:hypothetical protein SPURM210S_08256 [Streptomyces purpurascens]
MTTDSPITDEAAREAGVEVRPVAGRIAPRSAGSTWPRPRRRRDRRDQGGGAAVEGGVLPGPAAGPHRAGGVRAPVRRDRGAAPARQGLAAGLSRDRDDRRPSRTGRAVPAWSTTSGCGAAATPCCAAGTATTVPASTPPPRRSCAPRPYRPTAATPPGRTWRRRTPDGAAAGVRRRAAGRAPAGCRPPAPARRRRVRPSPAGPTGRLAAPAGARPPGDGGADPLRQRLLRRADRQASPAESSAILDLLLEQAVRPEYTVRFRWEPGSVAFWDNRAAVHLAPGDTAHLDHPRIMHRVMLAGDVLRRGGRQGVGADHRDGTRALVTRAGSGGRGRRAAFSPWAVSGSRPASRYGPALTPTAPASCLKPSAGRS